MKEMRSILEGFVRASDCSEIIWPGFDLSLFEVVVADFENNVAFVSKPSSGPRTIETELAAKFPPMPPYGYRLEGRMFVVSFDSTRGVGEHLKLLFHEAFHSIGRQAFVKGSWQRGVSFPEDWHPRYARREIARRLASAVQKPSTTLGDASFWWKAYLNGYPHDYQQSKPLDIREGTARFADSMGLALAKLGCNAGIREISKEAAKTWEGVDGKLRKTAEHYEIGGLASLLLELGESPNWRALVSAGQHPADLLLGPKAPIPGTEDPALKEEVRKQYEEVNKEMGALIEAFLADAQSSKYYLLGVPSSWRVGAYFSREHINFSRDGKRLTLLKELTVNLRIPKSGEILKVSGRTALVSGLTSAHGQREFWFVPIPREKVEFLDGNSIKISDDTLSVSSLQIRTIKISTLSSASVLLALTD